MVVSRRRERSSGAVFGKLLGKQDRTVAIDVVPNLLDPEGSLLLPFLLLRLLSSLYGLP